MMKRSSKKVDYSCTSLIEVNVETKIRKRIVSIFTILFCIFSLIVIFFVIKNEMF